MVYIDPKPSFEKMVKDGKRFESRLLVRECDLSEYGKEEIEENELLFKVGLAEIEGDKIKFYAPWSPLISDFFDD